MYIFVYIHIYIYLCTYIYIFVYGRSLLRGQPFQSISGREGRGFDGADRPARSSGAVSSLARSVMSDGIDTLQVSIWMTQRVAVCDFQCVCCNVLVAGCALQICDE